MRLSNDPNARRSGEAGFTLIELLIVILVIGILAAIALPSFLGQRTKGQDASAKSNARNAVSEIEGCVAERDHYLSCDEAAELGATGLNFGARADYVAADCDPPAEGVCVNSRASGFRVIAESKSGNLFTFDRVAQTRTCSVPNADRAGGCDTGGGGATTGTW